VAGRLVGRAEGFDADPETGTFERLVTNDSAAFDVLDVDDVEFPAVRPRVREAKSMTHPLLGRSRSLPETAP
jgi:hypothetical protein